MPDLERFGRALHLRWLWQEYGDDPKPWVGTEVPCKDTDHLFFNASTTVTTGNGNKARFWRYNWLDGEAPRYLAPHLFMLAHHKNRSVRQELSNGNWIRSLRTRITSAVLLQEFVGLWIRIQSVQLQPEVPDSITWKWTADRVYSTRSAYRVQFRGSHRKFQHDLIWKAKAKNKCKIHAWILLHDKILTADNLQKRGWPHQEHCALCNGPLENGLHLSLLRPFARAVWEVLSWENFALQLPQQDPSSLAT